MVILTISQAEEDITRGYNLHANCYITKPIDLHQFISRSREPSKTFWLTIVKTAAPWRKIISAMAPAS